MAPALPADAGRGNLGRVQPLAITGPLNAVIFGFTIFAVGQYLSWRLQSRFLVVWGCIAVALSVPLVSTASYALSDPLFILMTTLALIQTDKFLEQGKTSSLVWAAVFCALAWQTRHMGIAAPVLVGVLLLFQRGAPLPQKARRVAGFSLIAGLPMALWLLRNYLVAGDLPGNPHPVYYPLSEILTDIAGRLLEWVCVDKCATDMSLAQWLSLAFLLLSTAIIIIAGYVFIRNQRGKSLFPQWISCGVFGGFALIYTTMFIIAVLRGDTTTGIPQRYIAPMYIPALIIAATVLDRFLGPLQDRKLAGNIAKRSWNRIFAPGKVDALGLMTTILAIALSLWAVVQVVPNTILILRANSGDLDLEYNGPRWADSETLQYIQENPIAGKIHSNNPAVIYTRNEGIAKYYKLPTSRASKYLISPNNMAQGDDGQEQLENWLAGAEDGAYVVWFANWYNSKRYDYDYANFLVTPGLEPVAELSEGGIYKVNRDYDVSDNHYYKTYQATVSGDYGEPVARSTFDIYLNDGEAVYLKEPCATPDMEARFFLHIKPSDGNDLPDDRRESGFNNLDTVLDQRIAIFGGKCLATVSLPDYDIASIQTGQYVRGVGKLWDVDLRGEILEYMAEYRTIVSGEYGEPEARAAFNVYRRDDALIYLKEPCAAADTEARFYLHVYPADAANLPAERREYGFDNPDFQFTQHGVQWAGKCLAIVPLPGYEIARIRTGQYIVGGEQIWKAEQYIIGGSPVWRVQQDDLPPSSPYRMAYDAIASGGYGEPAGGGVFDVYRNGGELVYYKEPCAAADTEARFYLHLFPADPGALPAERREYGFDNPDFQFPQYGVRWGGRCLAIVPLPGYEIARIRTGQYIVGGEAIWQADFR